jgi:hypothetical protein
MSNTPDNPDRATRLAALWKECISLWRNLVLGFGHPVDLMRWGRMRALEHRGLGHWLRDLEALVRRAITSDALTRDVPASDLHAHRKRADRRRTPPASPEDMPRFRRSYRDDPTTWKVSFRMSKREYDPARRRKRRRSPRNTDPEARRPCRGYAFRIEALRRVIVNREAVVMRHARRLTRLAEAEAGRTYEPILLPDQSVEDAPERQIIRAKPMTAPPAGVATPGDTAPWNAKHIEPG